MSKKKSTPPPPSLSPENYIRKNSRNLPLYKCFVNEEWEKTNMCNILVTRKHVTGNVTACMYLVDLGCLGVKDTMFRFNVPLREIENILGKDISFIEISYDLVHNIIFSALEFAEDYGFKPHKDFTSITSHFLEEDTDDIPIIEIECGKDGKPMYVNSGYETAARQREILAQLERTAGEGNYYFMLKTDGEGNLHDNNEYDENDDDDLDLGEDNELVEEIVRMEKKEQRSLFQELLEDMGGDNFSIDKYKKWIFLTKFLSVELANNESITEYFDMLDNKFDYEFVADEELPNSLFADIQDMDGETLSSMLENVFADIMENKNPKEAIQLFRDTVGEAPISDFVELYYLNHSNNEEYEDYKNKLKEYHQKYPQYFLFQIYHQTYLNGGNDTEALEAIFLENKHPITESEANFFFHLYTYSFIAVNKANLSALVAFEDFILNLDFLDEETSEVILSTLCFVKSRIISEDIEQNGL